MANPLGPYLTRVDEPHGFRNLLYWFPVVFMNVHSNACV